MSEDARKLRLLADWFDEQDRKGKFGDHPGNEIQLDLRRMANRLERIDRRADEWLEK